MRKFLLDTGRLFLVDGGIALALHDLFQPPLVVEVANATCAFHLGAFPAPLIEPLARGEVGTVDDDMDGIAMGLVRLAVFVVKRHHYLLVRVMLSHVLLGIPHALFR